MTTQPELPLDITCEGCKDTDEPHDECGYENEDCLAGCTTAHDPPVVPDVTPRMRGADLAWECPESGDVWHWCKDCNDWIEAGPWGVDFMHDIDGYLICEACWEDVYTCCDDCGDTLYHDDAYCTDYGDRQCESCHNESDTGDEGTEGEGKRYCPTCSTYDNHFDPLTEQYLCDHKAAEARANRMPVLAAA